MASLTYILILSILASAKCFTPSPFIKSNVVRIQQTRDESTTCCNLFNNPFFSSLSSSPSPSSSLSPQKDTILVIGGTSGVGQLVTKKLRQKGFPVRITARNPTNAQELLNDSTIQTMPLDLIKNYNPQDLTNAMNGVSAIVISLGTTAFPTQKWKDGNTPQAIDQEAVEKIATIAKSSKDLRKIVLITSIGVDRTKMMPFLFLNLFGVLDAKKAGEDSIKEAGKSAGFDYVIVRPGRLIGGPYTNLDLAKLMQIEGGAENGVTMEEGDSLLGDCKRDACAEAVVQCVINGECKNLDFSIISNDEKAWTTQDKWTEQFVRMRQET